MNLQAVLGNFSVILFILTIVTGVIWFLDVFYFERQRRLRTDAALAAFDARNAKLGEEGLKQCRRAVRFTMEKASHLGHEVPCKVAASAHNHDGNGQRPIDDKLRAIG